MIGIGAGWRLIIPPGTNANRLAMTGDDGAGVYRGTRLVACSPATAGNGISGAEASSVTDSHAVRSQWCPLARLSRSYPRAIRTRLTAPQREGVGGGFTDPCSSSAEGGERIEKATRANSAHERHPLMGVRVVRLTGEPRRGLAMGESVTLTRDMLHAAGKESGSGAGGKRWSD